MQAKKHVLSSGLRLVVSPMAGTSAATVMIFVRAGSRCETPRENGLAHFQEHMFFKGAKKYPNTKAVAEAADNIGADQNAYTDSEEVAYYIQCSGAKVEVAFDVLSDMMLHAKFDPEEIERESSVIVAELKDGVDDPQRHVSNEWGRLIFGEQPIGRFIVGSEKNIRAFRRDDFVSYKNRLYLPDNIVIAVAGNVEEDHILQLTEKYFPLEKKPAVENVWPAFRVDLARQKAVSVITKDSNQAHFILGTLAPPENNPQENATKLLSAVLGNGMSSRLFLSVRERQGLAYYVYNTYQPKTDAGYFAAGAGVDPTAAEQAVRTIVSEYRKVYEHGVTAVELEKVKNMIEGSDALSLEGSITVAMYCGKQEVLHGSILLPEDNMKNLRAVTLVEVHEAARSILAPENLAMVIVGPHQDEAKLESLLSYK